MVIKLYDSPPIVDSSKFTGSDLSSPEVSSQPTWYTPSTTASNIDALNQRIALTSNSNSTKTKLPPIPNEVTFTAIGCDTEKKLAVASYMAMAAKAGIADVNAQRKFALNMTKDGFELKATPKEKPSYELTDRKVDEDFKGKSSTFVSSKADRDALEVFRRRYIESGGKIRGNSHPTIDIRTANIDAVAPTISSEASKTRPVYLDNNGEPVTNKRILSQYAEDVHPSGNIWGEGYRRIGAMSAAQGAKAEIKSQRVVGNKIRVDFDLSPEDKFKVQENYKIVQAEMNEVDAFRAKYNQENPLSQFILGTFDGAYASIMGNANAIMHPVETLSQIKEAIRVLSNLTSEDIANIYEQVKDSATKLVTTKDGTNSLPYKSGYVVGMGAAELITAKGVGAVLKGIKGVPAITNLVNKAEDLAALSKAKLLEQFSDEAARLATGRLRQRLVGTTLYGGIPADMLADFTVVSGNRIRNGAIKFADFSMQMVDDFGNVIKPQLEKLYRSQMIELGLADKIDEVGIKSTKLRTITPDPDAVLSPAQAMRNVDLAGKRHPVTGVYFDRNGYPVFNSTFDAKLPKNLQGSSVSDYDQFKEATKQLKRKIEANPATGKIYTDEQIRDIMAEKPRIKDLTWHHHQDGVRLQLVDSEIHGKTGHDGGRKNTGGRPW